MIQTFCGLCNTRMEYSVCTCDFALWRLIPKDILYNLNRKKNTSPLLQKSHGIISPPCLIICAACNSARNNRLVDNKKNPQVTVRLNVNGTALYGLPFKQPHVQLIPEQSERDTG